MSGISISTGIELKSYNITDPTVLLNNLLLESGDDFLLETGDYLLLE